MCLIFHCCPASPGVMFGTLEHVSHVTSGGVELWQGSCWEAFSVIVADFQMQYIFSLAKKKKKNPKRQETISSISTTREIFSHIHHYYLQPCPPLFFSVADSKACFKWSEDHSPWELDSLPPLPQNGHRDKSQTFFFWQGSRDHSLYFLLHYTGF